MHAVKLVGHRGARGLRPENTLEGFATALALGVDGIELDVTLTADGVPVLSHEPVLHPDLTRGADGDWLAGPGPPIRELRTAELAVFDVGRPRPGSGIAARFPDQIPCDGARIPRLEQAFALAKTCFIVELKTFPDRPGLAAPPEEMAEAVIAAADSVGAAAQIVVESFDWRGPRHLRRTRPELRLAWLTSRRTVAAAPLWWGGPRPADYGGSVPRAVATEGGPATAKPIWAPEHIGLTRDLIDEAHGLDLSVLAWTVNHQTDMVRFVRWGVDGLITDRPDIARLVLASEGLPLPAPLTRPPAH